MTFDLTRRRFLGLAAACPLAARPAPEPKLPASDASSKYKVSAKGLEVKLAADGEIVGVTANGRESVVAGRTRLDGCVSAGVSKVTSLTPEGGVEFARPLRHHESGRTVTVIDRFRATGDSVRWEIEIVSAGDPWTADISTELDYPATAATRFWTACSDPEHKNDGWRDPRVLLPFSDARWSYSNLDNETPEHGDFIALPLATVVRAWPR